MHTCTNTHIYVEDRDNKIGEPSKKKSKHRGGSAAQPNLLSKKGMDMF